MGRDGGPPPTQLNPLYVPGAGEDDGTTFVAVSQPGARVSEVKAAAPKQQQQQHRHQQRHSSRLHRWRRSCARRTPWAALLAAAVTAGILVVWVLFADRFVAACQAVLAAGGLATDRVDVGLIHFITRIALVSAVSAATGAFVLLCVAYRQHRAAKHRAENPSGWPHGCRSVTTRTSAALLSAAVWVLLVGLVALFTATAAAWLATLAGSLAAQGSAGGPPGALAVSPAVAAYLTAFNRVKQAYGAALRHAMASSVAATPWFAQTNAELLPVLNSLPWANATALAGTTGVCAAGCIDFSPLTKIPGATKPSTGSGSTCVCEPAAVARVQELLAAAWKDGLTALAALAALAVLATWMLMHCVMVCVAVGKDYAEARRCSEAAAAQHRQRAKHARDSSEQAEVHISQWVWQANRVAAASELLESASEVSSFPALQAIAANPGDQQQQQHDTAAATGAPQAAATAAAAVHPAAPAPAPCVMAPPSPEIKTVAAAPPVAAAVKSPARQHPAAAQQLQRLNQQLIALLDLQDAQQQQQQQPAPAAADAVAVDVRAAAALEDDTRSNAQAPADQQPAPAAAAAATAHAQPASMGAAAQTPPPRSLQQQQNQRGCPSVNSPSRIPAPPTAAAPAAPSSPAPVISTLAAMPPLPQARCTSGTAASRRVSSASAATVSSTSSSRRRWQM